MPYIAARRVKSEGESPPGHGGRNGSGPTWPGRMPPWAWFLTLGLAIIAVAMSGLLGSFEPTAVFVLGIATLVALVASIRLNRPALTWPWWAISAAMALFLAGGASASGPPHSGQHHPRPVPRPRPPLPPRLRPGGGGTARLLAGAPPRATKAPRGHPRRHDRRPGHPRGGLGLRHRPGPVPLQHTTDHPARAHVLPGHVDLPGRRDRADRLQPRTGPRPGLLVPAPGHDVHVRG